MMRIETDRTHGYLTLRVAGKLCGACVEALEDCWQAARADSPAGVQAVDLSSVTSIDRAGWSLLRKMHRQGVKLRAEGLVEQTIIDELADQTERC